MRKIALLLTFLASGACEAGGNGLGYLAPHYNFSSHAVLVREDVLATGATLVIVGGEEPYLNGFFVPSCRMTIHGKEVVLRNVIFINLDVIGKSRGSPDQVLLHELEHYRQYRRCASAEEYFAEWRRQQALPYWERPWEKEAHAAETRDTGLIWIQGKQSSTPVAIRFDFAEGGLASHMATSGPTGQLSGFPPGE
jgi:hypothetical protein